MTQMDLSLPEILNRSKWQPLQDALAETTQMAIITVDYKGRPTTAHSKCSEFCGHTRSNAQLEELCMKCDARGGLEAVRANRPYIYHCHFGIVDIAIPIIVDNQYLGAIMAGQVRLAEEDSEVELDSVFTPKNQGLLQQTLSDYKSAYAALPRLTLSEIESVTSMLYQLADYIIGEAVDKHLRQETLMTMLYGGHGSAFVQKTHPEITGETSPERFEVNAFKQVKKDIADSLLDVLLTSTPEMHAGLTHPALNAAFDYIYAHKSDPIHLEDVANACYLSPSYFSRLFKKEIGISFNAYVSKLKILWAKSLLETTTMPISQISDALGFSDSGYFIKKFKSHFGVTPGLYRADLKKSDR